MFYLLKAKGEGSRGGHVIGHTRSGKPIYDVYGHSAHKDFTPEDHADAYALHNHLKRKTGSEKKEKEHKTNRDLHAPHFTKREDIDASKLLEPKKEPKSLEEKLADADKEGKEYAEKEKTKKLQGIVRESDRYLGKAKKYVVGTIRKWKDGQYIKDNEHHWKLMQDLVHATAESVGVGKDDHETKLLHAMTSSALKHIKKHPSPNEKALDEHLDTFDHGTYENFDEFKGVAKKLLSDYVSEHQKLKTGKGEAETKTGKRQQSWKEQLAEQAHLSQDKKDMWVAAQFMKKKKPILHLLKIAREVIGDRKDIEPSKGFSGLCKVILDRAYERGPDAFEMDSIERFTKAFHTYLEKVTATKQSPSTTDDDKIEGLLERNPFYKEHEEWFRYCVHRMMEKNGAVSYSGLKPYMQNAMKKYNGVVPDYEGKKKKVAKKKYVMKKERA